MHTAQNCEKEKECEICRTIKNKTKQTLQVFQEDGFLSALHLALHLGEPVSVGDGMAGAGRSALFNDSRKYLRTCPRPREGDEQLRGWG